MRTASFSRSFALCTFSLQSFPMIDSSRQWSNTDSNDLYEVSRWGNGFFSVGENGHLLVHPERDSQRAIDLKVLIDRLEMRGFDLPILVRFNGILKERLREIHGVFQKAIDDNNYRGKYACVYPIKVNQQREVVEKIVEYGREFGFGLEAGSKPELLATVAVTDPDTPIVCNGFKDDEFIEIALLAQKIGRTVIPVVEKFSELERILVIAKRLGVRPQVGMRVKLAARGAGRWQSSGGYRSKFGLTVAEILKGLKLLESEGMADCFKLLHFHLGSQITNIRQVKAAITEAIRIYSGLYARGAGLEYLDVGGGLGVDYDGSQTNFQSSMNYTLQEYANDVIYHVNTVCEETETPHPTIISESGRAVAAFHSALIFGTLGVTQQGEFESIPDSIPDEYEQPLHDLFLTFNELTVRNIQESYHDAQQAVDMAMSLFSGGYLPLEQRVLAENLFFVICRKINKLTEELDYIPEELMSLNSMLSDLFFCNFSLFQSMPDSWAIKQLFPVMPIHRLNEQPTRHGVVCDITCDSDGKIDTFIDRRDVKKTLRLHEFDGSPYYLGAFLIGAYQEILGDLHNLFGDTNTVHIELDEQGEVVLQTLIKGETVNEVLSYVQFSHKDLLAKFQSAVETAVRENRIDNAEAGRLVRIYEDGLNGYTYLEGPRD